MIFLTETGRIELYLSGSRYYFPKNPFIAIPPMKHS